MKKITSILLLVLLASCDKELPTKLTEFDSKIVINSIFRPDTEIVVLLSNSVNIFSQETPKFLEGASITLFEENVLIGSLKDTVVLPQEGRQFQLRNGGSFDKLTGVYYIDYIPKPNLEYRLEVTHPDYPSASFFSSIPAKTSNFEVTLSKPRVQWFDEIPSGQIVPGGVEYTATIKFKDAPISNYYQIAQIGEHNEIKFDENGNSIGQCVTLSEGYYTSEDIVFNEVNKPEILDSRNPFDGDNNRVFSDVLFNNQEYSVDITFIIPVGIAAYYLDGDDWTVTATYQKFFIEVRSVSEDYYEYKRTLEIQRANAEDPFAEPTRVFSNVDGGLGIFAGYNVDLFEFSLEEFIPEG